MTKSPSNYYGSFFWLALVSFVVPLVVAGKAFHEIRLTTKPTPNPDASGVDHAIWDYLLKTYVENGLVDYDGLSRDHLFRTYLKQLSEADPHKLTTSTDELALLCNAYNAYVMNAVITHRIQNSVMDFQLDEKGFFDIKEHIFCGKTMSLNHIEHELIRKRFNDPRVHVALVCAAKSCPSIRPEAYLGKQLEIQLEDQSQLFANNPKYVSYDFASNSLQLSPLLNWYADDWQHLGGHLRWLTERVEEPSLRQAIQAAIRGEIPVKFSPYDWSLNTQSRVGVSSAETKKPSMEFGSGSVPNE